MDLALDIDVTITPSFKNAILQFGAKRKMLREMGDRLNTLVVGSSHGDFGFDPQYCQNSFNLCCRSQDLKHSFHLYKRTCETVKTVQNLVLFYSIFSSGNFMERSPGEHETCAALNEIFDLGLTYEGSHFSSLSALIKGRLDDVSIDLDGRSGFFPDTEKSFFPESYGAQRRAQEHLKLNSDNTANVFLLNMLQMANELNHNVIIVIPPVRQDYKAASGGDFNYLFRDLLTILERFKSAHPGVSLQLINGFDDSTFKDDFFGDYDHLLPTGEGVKILSSNVQRAIDLTTPADTTHAPQ